MESKKFSADIYERPERWTQPPTVMDVSSEPALNCSRFVRPFAKFIRKSVKVHVESTEQKASTIGGTLRLPVTPLFLT